jgi:hypothetical protein
MLKFIKRNLSFQAVHYGLKLRPLLTSGIQYRGNATGISMFISLLVEYLFLFSSRDCPSCQTFLSANIQQKENASRNGILSWLSLKGSNDAKNYNTADAQKCNNNLPVFRALKYIGIKQAHIIFVILQNNFLSWTMPPSRGYF